ncbi:MAG: SGNH/GDSL hydrolase family protein [Myxococcota bacterium]
MKNPLRLLKPRKIVFKNHIAAFVYDFTISTVGTVLFLVLLEFGFSIFVGLTSSSLTNMIEDYRSRWYGETSESLLYRPHPYTGYVHQQDLNINRHGFWGMDLPLEKPEGMIRVAAFGGSTTEGPLAWPRQLEVRLNRRCDGICAQVQNFGMGGWTSADAVPAMALIASSYSPDFVVVHFANNDLDPMRYADPAIDYTHYRRNMDVLEDSPGEPKLRKGWFDHIDAIAVRISDLYVYAKLWASESIPTRANLHRLTTWPFETLSKPSPLGIEIFERNLVSIAALAEAHGATMVLTNMPMLTKERPGVPRSPPEHLQLLTEQNDRLRLLAQKKGWVFADLAQLSEELTPHFEDAVHVTVDGERIKARGIEEALEASGLLDDTVAKGGADNVPKSAQEEPPTLSE